MNTVKSENCFGEKDSAAFDATLYPLRNTVERGFNRVKQWRGIATRYDKYALTYLGSFLLRCVVIHARVGILKLGDTL